MGDGGTKGSAFRDFLTLLAVVLLLTVSGVGLALARSPRLLRVVRGVLGGAIVSWLLRSENGSDNMRKLREKGNRRAKVREKKKGLRRNRKMLEEGGRRREAATLRRCGKCEGAEGDGGATKAQGEREKEQTVSRKAQQTREN
jgi:hypothetical protein